RSSHRPTRRPHSSNASGDSQALSRHRIAPAPLEDPSQNRWLGAPGGGSRLERSRDRPPWNRRVPGYDGSMLPDRLTVEPIARFRGTLVLPGSKSLSNRILLLSALAEGETEVTG